MAWVTPRTYVAGAVLTAAQLNETRDNLKAIGDPWGTYTPTLTQSVAVSKTVTFAKYMEAGNFIVGHVKLAVTSAGTASNAITLTLPVAAAQSGPCSGTGVVYDASAGLLYKGLVNLVSSTTVTLLNTGDTALGSLGQSGMTAALASGDEVNLSFFYEAA